MNVIFPSQLWKLARYFFPQFFIFFVELEVRQFQIKTSWSWIWKSEAVKLKTMMSNVVQTSMQSSFLVFIIKCTSIIYYYSLQLIFQSDLLSDFCPQFQICSKQKISIRVKLDWHWMTHQDENCKANLLNRPFISCFFELSRKNLPVTISLISWVVKQ